MVKKWEDWDGRTVKTARPLHEYGVILFEDGSFALVEAIEWYESREVSLPMELPSVPAYMLHNAGVISEEEAAEIAAGREARNAKTREVYERLELKKLLEKYGVPEEPNE